MIRFLTKQWVALTKPYAGFGTARYSALDNMRFHDETRFVRRWHGLWDRLERIFAFRLACAIAGLLTALGIAFFVVWNVFGWLSRAIPVLQNAGLL